MIPFCSGMPVRFGTGSPWRVSDLHLAPSGEFSGLITITRGKDTLHVPPDAITPVDNLPWFEPVDGAASIFHYGLADLREEMT